MEIAEYAIFLVNKCNALKIRVSFLILKQYDEQDANTVIKCKSKILKDLLNFLRENISVSNNSITFI